MSEFFGNVAHEDEDELLEELDKLESENVEEQLEEIPVPSKGIEGKMQIVVIGKPEVAKEKAIPAKAKAAGKEDESKMLADLMSS